MSDLTEQAFFESLPLPGLEILAAEAQRKTLATGDFVARQHDRAVSADFLQSGRVQVLLRFEGAEDLIIETLTQPGAMIGWSVFRPPFRYTASIRCEEPCELLRIPRSAFDRAFEQDPTLEYQVLQLAGQIVADRLARTQSLLLTPRDAVDHATTATGRAS